MPIDPNKSKFRNDKKDYPLVPEGIHTVEIVDVELKENQKGYKGKVIDKLFFYMGVLDKGDNRDTSIRYSTSLAYNGRYTGGSASKLYELACAVYGETLDPEEEFDANTLIGGRLRVVVKHVSKDDNTYANVKEVMKVEASGKKLPGLSDEVKAKIEPKTKSAEDVISEEDMKDISEKLDDPALDVGPDLDSVSKE